MNHRQSIKKSEYSPFNKGRIKILPTLNFKGRPKSINIDQRNLLCHSTAREAFLAWHQIPKKNSTYLASDASITLIQENNKKAEQFYFFDSFNQLSGSCRSLAPINFSATVIKEENVDLLTIQLYSWFEVIKLLLDSRIDEDVGYPVFRQLINSYMPNEIKKYFFDTNKLSAGQLCKLANLIYNFKK